jgi:hypothetical protein
LGEPSVIPAGVIPLGRRLRRRAHRSKRVTTAHPCRLHGAACH